MDIFNNNFERLDFEKLIAVGVIILSLLNIYGNDLQQKFLKTNIVDFKNKADKLYLFVLIVTLLFSIYFLVRNYDEFMESSEEDKNIFLVRTIGSFFFVAGVILLIYFQLNNSNFIGTTEI